MRYYFAPLEGLTDSIYRRLHHKYFPGLTQYYTPFVSPTVHRQLTPRERRELEKTDFAVVPQILTKVPEDFLWMAQQCRDLGYTEVNLNLGCPSGTVTAKGKGSGMLRDPDALDRFLDAIYRDAPVEISIKTRLGFADPEEFPSLLDIFNRYPVKELTLHPRVRTAFYSGSVNMDAFAYCVANSKAPVCYNGDLCNPLQIKEFSDKFPQIDAVMLGRGLVADPGMLTGGTDAKTLQKFHDALLEEYIEAYGGARNAMFRLKENWRHLICKFDGGDKLWKRLRKTTDVQEFIAITREIFETLPLLPETIPNW